MIDEMYNPDRISRVSGVSWWELGNEVYAMTEYKDGQKVDPHNIIAIGIKHALKKQDEFSAEFPHLQDKRVGISKKILLFSTLFLYIPQYIQ